MSGTMGFNEFKELWAILNGWRQHFMSVDADRSGTVDSQELQKALLSMGELWNFSLAGINGHRKNLQKNPESPLTCNSSDLSGLQLPEFCVKLPSDWGRLI